MHLTLQQARELFDKVPQKNIDLNKLTNTPAPRQRQRSRYDEHHIVQAPFVKSFREVQAKGLFDTVPGLEFIELSATPQAGEDSDPKDKARAQKAIIRGQRNKALGYKAGWPDITIIWKFDYEDKPDFGFIESKTEDGPLSESQKIFHPRLHKAKVKTEVMRNRKQGFLILKKWGLLPKCCESMII